MVVTTTSNLNGAATKLGSGYRLARLEVYNWGTFNDLWVIEPQGKMALLTGANGSGKSTLVDALLTLLVPNQGRNYNQAAGTDGKQERNEQSYVLGAYKQTSNEDGTGGKVEYLRGKDSYSVLLAVFENAAVGSSISLARVFWFQPDLHRFFVVAKEPLTIKEHFQVQGEMKNLKVQLKRREKVNVYDQFKEYSTQFRKLVHLRSEKALDLFNQIVAIKEIGGLNDFVRRHMLETIQIQTHIDDLRANYENLNRAYDAIQKAEKQQAELRPLLEDAQRYQNQIERIAETEAIIDALPHFFNLKRVDLYAEAIDTARAKLEQWHEEERQASQTRDSLREEEKNLDLTIRQDEIGQRLVELQREIQTATRLMNERKAEARKYTELVKRVKLDEATDSQLFAANRAEAQNRQSQLEKNMEKLAKEKQELNLKERDTRAEVESLQDEIDELSKRKSQIPIESLQIRNLITEKLGIDEAALPFAGELLKVRDEAEAWEAAIERLLNGFARQMLVPESYYHKVNKFVDDQNLRGRLVYHPIQSVSAPSLSRIQDESVYHKLQIKPDTEFHDWLSNQLVRSYDYICCNSLKQFQHEERALTQNGQIKHGGNRHEKDDRRSLGDRRYYVLGWDNREKLAVLQQEHHDKQQDLAAIRAEISELEREEKRYQALRDTLRDVLSYSDFSRIDWYTPQASVQRYETEKRELEASANHLHTLQEQLKQVRAKLAEQDKQLARLQSTIGTLENDIKRYDTEGRKAEIALQAIDINQYATIFRAIEKTLKSELTLENINDIREERITFYNNSHRGLSDYLKRYSDNIIRAIANFKSKNEAETQEVDASVDSIPWFEQKYAQIERDDLPKHKERFRELMNRNVIQTITIFQEQLNQQEHDIKASIDQLNLSLRGIPYTNSTYIQLVYRRNPDREIQTFRSDLANCYPNVADGDAANEVAFKKIRALIKRLEDELRWTQKVSDVRNWLNFSAEERWNNDDSIKEHYDSSSGKSGGQKAKLAYTILASAIAYQYRLDDVDERDKTFRFVVVDEIFSKSDEQNSRFAMDLFKQLELQVLVVTPADKIYLVEPYIGTCHFVTNNEEGKHSQVLTLTLQELKERRLR